jgi:hypothetical protein
MNGSKTVTANFFVPSSSGIVSGTIASLTTTTGNPLDYSMLVPPNAVNLVFKLSGGTGDVDLLVNANRSANFSDYDCYSYRSDNDELCVIPASKTTNGQYFVTKYLTPSASAKLGRGRAASSQRPSTPAMPCQRPPPAASESWVAPAQRLTRGLGKSVLKTPTTPSFVVDRCCPAPGL